MPTLTIRNIDEWTHQALRVRAAKHGRSMEAEVRDLLEQIVRQPDKTPGEIGREIHAAFAKLGGADDLIARLPERAPLPEPVRFDSE